MNAPVRRPRGSVVLFGLTALVVGFHASPGEAAAMSGGILAAETAACRVLVTKVSYDDPGADDAEFIELRVERTGPVLGTGPSPLDAAAPGARALDASPPGSTPSLDAGVTAHRLTLGDCGLASLELVNGGSGACEIYRTLPLSSVVVADDDYVTFCATDSTLAAARCDVMAAGRSALRNGWLQNGPSDGLRFRAGDGSVLELSYEGRVGCFQPNALALVDETGQAPGSSGTLDAPDDVNTLSCDGVVLLPITDAPLRHEARCPSSPSTTSMDAAAPEPGNGHVVVSDRSDAGTTDADAGPWNAERAPVTRPKGAPSLHAALGLDAGLVAIPRPPSDPPPGPPGCSMTRRAPAGPGAPGGVLALLALLASVRRWCRSSGLRGLGAHATDATSGGSEA